jgi:fucose 4-O-acetylase-like acetyltransferase
MGVSKKNQSIDVAKGFLILLVVIVHAIGRANDNLFAFLIHTSCIPLFFFMSGYLVKYDKFSSITFKIFFQKYFKRLILPWLFAMVVYTAFAVRKDVSLFSITQYIIYPYVHLWFIPSLFFMLLFTKIMSNIFVKKNVLIIGGILGLLFFSFRTYILVKGYDFKIPSYVDLQYYLFWLLGVYMNTVKIEKKLNGLLYLFLFIIIGVIWYFSFSINPFWQYRIYLFIPLNILSSLVLISYVQLDELPKSTILAWMGSKSLELYLWHMIPILILNTLFRNHIIFLFSFFSFLIIFFIGLYIYLNGNNRIYSCSRRK